MVPASVSDYRALARRRLPRLLFDYLDGGAFDEQTLAANRRDLRRLALRQRVLRDVAEVDPSTTLLGGSLALPLVLAPVGFAGMLARRGEVAAARAATRAGVPFTLSTVAVCPLAEVRAATGGALWFQLYMMKDRGVARELLARAREAGCGTLVFTVDVPVLGTRYRDLRNGFAAEPSLAAKLRLAAGLAAHPRWLCDVALRGRPLSFGNLAGVAPAGRSFQELMRWTAQALDASATWKDLDWIRSQWPGPLVLKGVLDVDDARAAVAAGAEAIVVSNHGGRQLDAAVSSISALPQIAAAVGDRTAVLMDGGIRSGQDVVRALALGARACLIGRAWAYGAAAAGESGVTAVLGILEQELRTSMALIGCTRIADIDRGVLEVRSGK